MKTGTLFAYFVTFTASFCMMVIELVAGRILAPYIGQHLYSWTSIIGVCLAGISVGAWLGGMLADKFPRRATLGWFLFLAGLFSLAIPFLTDQICSTDFFYLIKKNSVSLMMRIVIYTATIFLPATLVLGMISPMVIKLIIRDLTNAGSVVGRIYSFSTVGSILGTFATGFFLIEEFGTRLLLYAVGAVLIVMAPLAGGLFSRGTKYVGGAVIGLLLGVIVSGFLFPDQYVKMRDKLIYNLGQPYYYYYAAPDHYDDDEETLAQVNENEETKSFTTRVKEGGFTYPHHSAEYYKESNYYTLRVVQHDHNDPSTGELRPLYDLILDNLVHSHSDLADPFFLEYEYLRIYEELVGWQLNRKGSTKHSQLFVGGGGYTLQRLFHARYKDCHVDVVEIDPDVTKVAETYMGAPRNDPRLVTTNEDGRLYVLNKQKTNDKYEFIFGDAFNDLSVPFHLTTQEFDQQLKNLLTPNGLVMSLVIDNVGQGLFLPSFIATMRKAFGDENVVLILTNTPRGRQEQLDFLKKLNMEKYIERLSKEPIDNVIKELLTEQLKKEKSEHYLARLDKENPDVVIRDILLDYLKQNDLKKSIKLLEKTSWETAINRLDSSHNTDAIKQLRKIASLKFRKVDDSAPYIKPMDLDYMGHNTVIVVGTATRQDWNDFEKYLNDLETNDKKRTTSHVIRPEKLNEYLATRTREPNLYQKITKGNNRVPWTPVVLTDDYAPVDNLLAPVFEQRFGFKKKRTYIDTAEEDEFIDQLIKDMKEADTKKK